MEISAETKSFAEIISTSINCDNLDDELLDPEFGLNSRENPEMQKNLFDTEMDELVSSDFMHGNNSPLSEDLEIEKIMEQLESTIQEDIFAGNRNISISNKINSMRENEDNFDELNLLNNDIISYISSDDKDLTESRFNREDLDEDCDKNKNNGDVIDLINKELEETLQFTDVLCHYVYSDVIIGRDFFKLFNSENIRKKDLNSVTTTSTVE